MFLELLRSETSGEPERMKAALEGLRRYQEAPRNAGMAPKPAVAEASGAALRDYGGIGPPTLFVPSLINPPSVLDLSADKSLLRRLAEGGHRVLLLDWGSPDQKRQGLSVSGHVEDILVPLGRPAVYGFPLGHGERLATVPLCVGVELDADEGTLRVLEPWFA